MTARPPELARLLLRWCAPSELSDAMTADLDEEFHSYALPQPQERERPYPKRGQLLGEPPRHEKPRDTKASGPQATSSTIAIR